MNLPAHLRRSRHGIYYFRIVLPEAVAEITGRREFIRSLSMLLVACEFRGRVRSSAGRGERTLTPTP